MMQLCSIHSITTYTLWSNITTARNSIGVGYAIGQKPPTNLLVRRRTVSTAVMTDLMCWLVSYTRCSLLSRIAADPFSSVFVHTCDWSFRLVSHCRCHTSNVLTYLLIAAAVRYSWMLVEAWCWWRCCGSRLRGCRLWNQRFSGRRKREDSDSDRLHSHIGRLQIGLDKWILAFRILDIVAFSIPAFSVAPCTHEVQWLHLKLRRHVGGIL